VAMSDLQIGDVVLAISDEGSVVASEVYAFGHRDSEVSTSFVVISTDSGHSLVLTEKHLVPICLKGMEFVLAGSVKAGDTVYVQTPNGTAQATVSDVHFEERQGLYAPITLEGTVFANGVAASCYAEHQSHDLMHLGMAPVRMFYQKWPSMVIAGHFEKGMRLNGAHIYIDMCSIVSPLGEGPWSDGHQHICVA